MTNYYYYYYYKQHITHQQYKNGMCIYIYQMKKWVLARSNQKKKKKIKMVWIFTYKLKKKKSFLICRIINVCERESLGMEESWEKWELSELWKVYQCIKFIFETVRLL